MILSLRIGQNLIGESFGLFGDIWYFVMLFLHFGKYLIGESFAVSPVELLL